MAIGTAAAKEYPKAPALKDAKGVFSGFWEGKDTEGKLNGKPTTFPSFNEGGPDSVRYKMKVVDPPLAEIEVPGSFTWPDEFVPFAVANGVDVRTAKSLLNPDAATESLIKLSLAIMEKGQVVTFTAPDKQGKGAWIQYITEMRVPDGTYYGIFDRVTSVIVTKDAEGKVTSVKPGHRAESNNFGGTTEKVRFNFRIMAGSWKGSVVPASATYPILNENGQAVFPLPTKDGSDRVDVGRFKKIVFLTTNDPQFFDKLTPADANNVMPEIEAAAKEAKQMVMFVVTNGFADARNLAAMPEGVSIPDDAPAVIRPPVEKSQAVGMVYDVIQKNLGDVKAFKPDGSLTDEAKAWAATYIKPICAENNFKAIPRLWTTAQVVLILEGLEKLGLADAGLAAKASTLSDNEDETL